MKVYYVFQNAPMKMEDVPWTTNFWDLANCLRERNIICDLELSAPYPDGTIASFQVHKLLFSLASNVLMTKMVQNELDKEVRFNAITAEGLYGLVQFVYGQNIDATQDEYKQYLQAANVLKVPHAQKVFQQILTKTRTVDFKISHKAMKELQHEMDGIVVESDDDNVNINSCVNVENTTAAASDSDWTDNNTKNSSDSDQIETISPSCETPESTRVKKLVYDKAPSAAGKRSRVLKRKQVVNKALVHVCTLCNDEFRTKGLLQRHQREIHNVGKEYKCEHCERRFLHKTQYEYHVRSHTNEKPFVCEQCGKSFAAPSSLKLHMESHKPENEKKFSCPQCHKKFAQKGNMERHILGRHTQEKIYTCDICGKSFHWHKSFIDHRKRHEGPMPKNHKCDRCEYAFDTKYKLERHKVVHSNVKPFECDWCGQKFTQVGSMNKHKKDSCKFKPGSASLVTAPLPGQDMQHLPAGSHDMVLPQPDPREIHTMF